MWKKVESLLGQLSPLGYGSKRRTPASEDSGQAGVELSVRQAPGEATELRSFKARTAAHQDSAAGQHSSGSEAVEGYFNDHPLQISSRQQLPARAGQAVPTTAKSRSRPNGSAASPQPGCSSAASSGAAGKAAASYAAVQQQLAAQGWISQGPNGARLVLSIVCELAAAGSPQQQQPLLAKLQLAAGAGSWEAACMLLTDGADLPRALAAHYQLPVPAQDSAQQLCTVQDGPLGSLPVHFVATAAAAGGSKPGSDTVDRDVQHSMQLLESCVLLGEAVRLQQQQQGAAWAVLLQLAEAQSKAPQQQKQQQAAGAVLQPQQAAAMIWPLLQAWAAAVSSAAATSAHTGVAPAHADAPQLLHADWGKLLSALQHLQQQVQEAVPVMQEQAVQDPLQQHASAAGTAPNNATSSGGARGSSSAPNSSVGQSQQGTELLQQHQLLQELCTDLLPVLLQPADMAGVQLQEGAAAPDSMALVVLLRLASATSSLWLPLLGSKCDTTSNSRNSSNSSSPAQQVAAATAAAAANAAAEDAAAATTQSGAARLRLPLQQQPQDRQAAAAAVWRGAADSQAAADLSPGPADSAAAAAAAASAALKTAVRSPRSSWPDELLSTAQLWPGDIESEDDAAAITREERTLRAWINSVLHRNAAHATAAVQQQHHQQQQLAQSFSVDSGMGPGRAQGQSPEPVPPVRWQSLGGPVPSAAGAAGVPGSLASASSSRASSSSGAVFRSSSAGAAAVVEHLNGDADCGSPAHSRSISADAAGAAADVALDRWGGEPAAPSTPTSAAAAAAAAGGAGSGSSSSRAAGVPSISSVSSLFGPELRSGVLLLEILELLQPGCVDWRLANRPPFANRTAQLKALENCQLALKVAQEELGLPLVSMSPRDIVLGRRKIILSLVYQLMRYNTMQLLESISEVQHHSAPSRRTSVTGGSEPSTPVGAADAHKPGAPQLQLPPSGLHFARHLGGRVNIRSSSRKQRRQLAITEQDILEWANSKLQQVKPLATQGTSATADAPVIRSFKDPVLSSGVVLLQLLHVLTEAVDFKFVTPGDTAEQRQSNARYALSLADQMGCSLFLVWEDLVDPPQPRMVLVLLASLMYQDLQRQQGTLGSMTPAH